MEDGAKVDSNSRRSGRAPSQGFAEMTLLRLKAVHPGVPGRLAAWHLPDWPVGPASRWAATSEVEVGQSPLKGKDGEGGQRRERRTKSQRGGEGSREWNGEGRLVRGP